MKRPIHSRSLARRATTDAQRQISFHAGDMVRGAKDHAWRRQVRKAGEIKVPAALIAALVNLIRESRGYSVVSTEIRNRAKVLYGHATRGRYLSVRQILWITRTHAAFLRARLLDKGQAIR